MDRESGETHNPEAPNRAEPAVGSMTCALESCGASLADRPAHARFCSRACSNAAYRETRRALRRGERTTPPCETCGAQLTGRRGDARFCNRRCRHASTVPSAPHAPCEGCGESMEGRQVQARFCTPRCGERSRSLPNTFPAAPLRALVVGALRRGWTGQRIAKMAHLDERRISALLGEQSESVLLGTADAICCALSVHIGVLYPEYWG